MTKRVGLWMIGARGGVASIAALGQAALKKGLIKTTGLVSELPQFQSLDLVKWQNVVLGGHDIRMSNLLDEVVAFQNSSRALDSSVVARCADDLNEFNERIRPGIVFNVGSTIEQLADPAILQWDASPRESIERVKNDLRRFTAEHQLARTIVINLASTEQKPDGLQLPESWEQAETQLGRADDCALPSSSLYAIAAMELGHAYVNFTPSLGSNCEAVNQLADQMQVPHAGQDGKTGETLIKGALAPVFAMRNLNVMSWVGHNIFGNLDGKVLDDPLNKKSKLASKDKLLGEILGYHPQTHISIEYIKSLGDWKTAWDHVHFQGFLGTPMVMQFTWQGCDSILAAPLVLDLFRFAERAQRAGQYGVLSQLSCFFKTPIGATEHNFVKQFEMLEQWAANLKATSEFADR